MLTTQTEAADKHREFAMAAGEMSRREFTAFLESALRALAEAGQDGALLYVCMDWRHLLELLTAGDAVGLGLQNICVWNKNNGGMGSLYRSKHELVCVFKSGTARHVNNIELGKHGRYRTNVWEYAGVNTFCKGRMDDLAAHPTVKPTALVADAIKDCSRRGEIVLDAFLGSGTIAARRVDIVVVYKVDRLTRSLADFAKLVETFDATGASFVSVTQQFNTSTSMGRLCADFVDKVG